MFPPKLNTLVPFDFSVPIFANSSAPPNRIAGIFAKVSTLLIIVGLPQSPFAAGNGGLLRDIPRPPSIEAINAVSSPQTNAPAPRRISISKLNPDPKMFSPIKPSSFA